MRKLKFRVWDLENKYYLAQDEEYHFYKTHHLTDYLSFWQCPISLSECFLDEKNYIIQQFTGLKDPENKEIYEGDVLSHNGKMGDVYYNTDAGGFVLEYKYSAREQNYVNLTCDIAFESANIGNIFENKDLLK